MANTLYDLLEVSRTASGDSIAANYKRLQTAYSAPAAAGDESTLHRLIAIKEAYATLSDPLRRQRYDDGLAEREARSETPAAGSGGLKWLMLLAVLGVTGFATHKYSVNQEQAAAQERLRLQAEQAAAEARLAQIEAQRRREERLAAEREERQRRETESRERMEQEQALNYSRQVSRDLERAEDKARDQERQQLARDERQKAQAERQRQSEAERQLAREQAFLRQRAAEKNRYY